MSSSENTGLEPDVTIVVPAGDEAMAVELGAVSAEMLQLHALNGAQRQADGAANVAEQTRLGYLESKEKIGVREAQAMQDVRTSAIAREVVQQRSVRDQPQAGAAP
jgi:hypothetical protein